MIRKYFRKLYQLQNRCCRSDGLSEVDIVTCGDSKRTRLNLYYAFSALLPNGRVVVCGLEVQVIVKPFPTYLPFFSNVLGLHWVGTLSPVGGTLVRIQAEAFLTRVPPCRRLLASVCRPGVDWPEGWINTSFLALNDCYMYTVGVISLPGCSNHTSGKAGLSITEGLRVQTQQLPRLSLSKHLPLIAPNGAQHHHVWQQPPNGECWAIVSCFTVC